MSDDPASKSSCCVIDLLKRLGPRAGGGLLLIAGSVALMGIITAETLYPDYSTSDNMISDLGATEPPDSIIEQPSSYIFSGAMAVTGILVLVATFPVHLAFKSKAFTVLVGLFGLGVLGVGVFNGSWGTVHALFAMTTFVAGALAAIVSFRVLPGPMRYISVVLGLVSFVTLLEYFALGDSSPMLEMGEGGVERWIAYPVLLWTMGLGGFMMGIDAKE